MGRLIQLTEKDEAILSTFTRETGIDETPFESAIQIIDEIQTFDIKEHDRELIETYASRVCNLCPQPTLRGNECFFSDVCKVLGVSKQLINERVKNDEH